MTIESIEREIERAERRLDRLAQRREFAEALGEDSDYEEGTILCWEQEFVDMTAVDRDRGRFAPGKRYSYVAIKANGWWYVSGRSAPISQNWASMIQQLQKAVDGVWIVTQVERIV